jgi:hypothetical protein
LEREPKAERKGRSEAEVCTSEARKTAGNPLTRAIGAEPLSEVWLPLACASAHWNCQGGRCGRERPAEVGGGRREAAADREDFLPATRGSFQVST